MLKLNIGSNKKVGLPDYGSKGASVHLELELDSSLAQNPAQLQGHIKTLFQQARDAVEAELFGREKSPGYEQNGSATNGNGHQRQSNGRRATNSQVKAIYAITRNQRIDMVNLLQTQYQVDRPEDLSLQEASRLIDELKNQPSMNGGGR